MENNNQTTERNSQSSKQDKNRSGRDSQSGKGLTTSFGDSQWATTVGSALATEAANYAPELIETISQGIQKKLGSSKMQKWVDMLNMESVTTGQSVLQNVIQSALPNLPEDIDFKDVPSLLKWEPIKSRMAKNPLASSAIIVAGVGALYLISESSFIKTAGGKTTSKPAGKKPVSKKAVKNKKR